MTQQYQKQLLAYFSNIYFEKEPSEWFDTKKEYLKFPYTKNRKENSNLQVLVYNINRMSPKYSKIKRRKMFEKMKSILSGGVIP